MAGQSKRRRHRPVASAAAVSEASPQRFDAVFDDWRTASGLNTSALHDALRQVNYGDATHSPQLMVAACAVSGFLGMHRSASNDGRRWVCVVFRTAHEYRVMIAVPVVRDVLPVVCTQGANDDTARSFLDDFTATLA